jgi:hypothetical protein
MTLGEMIGTQTLTALRTMAARTSEINVAHGEALKNGAYYAATSGIVKRQHHVTKSGVYRVRCRVASEIIWTDRDGYSLTLSQGCDVAFSDRAASLRFRRFLKANGIKAGL